MKPPPDRLYGRARGHKLRPRQERLLEATLPRLTLTPEQAEAPLATFGANVRELWLEVGFGGGEHALAQIAAHPHAALIACEVFENGICSLLSRLVPEGGEADAPLPPNLRLWPDDARRLDLPPAARFSRSAVPALSRPVAQGTPRQAALSPSGLVARHRPGHETRRRVAHRHR